MAIRAKVPLVVQKPAVPSTSITCPPGLEYLAMLDQLIVQQQVELLEAIMPIFETENKYVVKNSMGQFIYLISEDSNVCVRMCCGPQRCLQMSVQDFRGQEVMRFIRPCRCTACCCPCCLQTIEVQAPPGTTIGHVNQDWSICFPNFTICSRTGNALVKVKGPFCTQSLPCCGDVKFRVTTMAGNEIGVITKQWSGIVKEYFTDADNFGVSFPLDMDVHCKAALLACTMLIDYMFFETTTTGKRDAPGMLD